MGDRGLHSSANSTAEWTNALFLTRVMRPAASTACTLLHHSDENDNNNDNQKSDIDAF